MIKQVCELASVKFLKAVDNIGYMEDFYSEIHYKNLEKAIKDTCEDLILKIFDGKRDIDEKDLLKNIDKPEFVWLNSFFAIRERMHEIAKIDKFHINEKESERALNRLIHQQEKVQEKAFQEEQESKKRE